MVVIDHTDRAPYCPTMFTELQTPFYHDIYIYIYIYIYRDVFSL
jgi:hypothetical protein